MNNYNAIMNPTTEADFNPNTYWDQQAKIDKWKDAIDLSDKAKSKRAKAEAKRAKWLNVLTKATSENDKIKAAKLETEAKEAEAKAKEAEAVEVSSEFAGLQKLSGVFADSNKSRAAEAEAKRSIKPRTAFGKRNMITSEIKYLRSL
jgi:hypothetical protein